MFQTPSVISSVVVVVVVVLVLGRGLLLGRLGLGGLLRLLDGLRLLGRLRRALRRGGFSRGRGRRGRLGPRVIRFSSAQVFVLNRS
jgi:hypothetical protein